jgi:carbamoyltransferase
VAGGRFTEQASLSSFDSLGAFYSYVTQICGFKAGRHEGKITGLAAYGQPAYLPQLRQIMATQNGTVKNVANVFFLSALRELERLLPPDFSHRDLAASVQVHTEDLVVHMVRHWLERTRHPDVALAGGLFANVKINQRVLEIPGVQSVYVHPAMSDAGMSVGAALAVYHDQLGRRARPGVPAMEHVYLGPEYSDEEIRAALHRHGVEAVRHDDIEREIGQRLAEGAVVARFNGRMEYGPRALGNRTIFYQATDPSVNFWMNDALKRTEFMPFAPIVMAEHAGMCFKNVEGAENTARFMTITFECTEWMARHCPGVVHVDNTARPQLVGEHDNPSAHRILKEYYRRSGIPCLINTSFNMHEEPIVCSPDDAIRAFQLGNLDYLAIGQWLAKNPSALERKVDRARLERYLNRRGVIQPAGAKRAVEPAGAKAG